jgi:hypothetical protein
MKKSTIILIVSFIGFFYIALFAKFYPEWKLSHHKYKEFGILFIDEQGQLRIIYDPRDILKVVNAAKGNTQFSSGLLINKADILRNKAETAIRMATFEGYFYGVCSFLIILGLIKFFGKKVLFIFLGKKYVIKSNLKNTDWVVRRQTVWKINDYSILLDVAKNDNNENVRAAAIGKLQLNDENIFIDIAKNDQSSIVRDEAISKINNENILIEIFKNEGDTDICLQIIKKISNSQFLEEIAKNHTNNTIKTEACLKLNKLSQNNTLKSLKND